MISVYFVVAFFGWYSIHKLDLFLTKDKKRFHEEDFIIASAIIYSDIFMIFVALFAIFTTSPEESEWEKFTSCTYKFLAYTLLTTKFK